jgi:TRAP-type C4-dicarboxylate transport system permease small subunit
MKKIIQMIAGISRQLDILAGICLTGVMILVVANILMRSLFNQPILGTYDVVGLLTALGIGFALANCAILNGHIAVDFVVDRLPIKIQVPVDILVDLIGFGFWGLVAWHVGAYAKVLATNGVVSATAQIPLYPIVYLIAFSLAGLSLVLLARLINSLAKAVAGVSMEKLAWSVELSDDSARKAVR